MSQRGLRARALITYRIAFVALLALELVELGTASGQAWRWTRMWCPSDRRAAARHVLQSTYLCASVLHSVCGACFGMLASWAQTLAILAHDIIIGVSANCRVGIGPDRKGQGQRRKPWAHLDSQANASGSNFRFASNLSDSPESSTEQRRWIIVEALVKSPALRFKSVHGGAPAPSMASRRKPLRLSRSNVVWLQILLASMGRVEGGRSYA